MPGELICKLSLRPLDKKIKNNIISLKQSCMKVYLDSIYKEISPWLTINNRYIEELPINLRYDLQEYLISNYIKDKYGKILEEKIFNSYDLFDNLIKLSIGNEYEIYKGKIWLFEAFSDELSPPSNYSYEDYINNIPSWEIIVDSNEKIEEMNQAFMSFDKKYYLSPNFRGIINIKTIMY